MGGVVKAISSVFGGGDKIGGKIDEEAEREKKKKEERRKRLLSASSRQSNKRTTPLGIGDITGSKNLGG